MILRKPYKFLIKHFRFIHLILALLSTYLLTKTYSLWNFFKEYVNSSSPIVPSGTSNEYFSGSMILACILVVVGSIIILVLMRMKKKPVIYYIVSIISYLLIIFVYIYDINSIKQLEVSALDMRIIGLLRDFTQISFIIQVITTIVFYIRAVGFNIKKFDFVSDLKLETDEKDNEEFEFELTFNKDKAKRNFKKRIRNLRINYLENKFIINVFSLIVILVITGLFLLNKFVFNKVYKEGHVFNVSNYSLQITDSYITNTDYKNDKISDNYLVIVKFNITKYSNIKDKVKFNKAGVLLNVGKVHFNPITKYSDLLLDFGTTYTSQNIVPESQEFILVFEVPEKYKNKKMILSYDDTFDSYKIKLSPEKFNKKEEINKVELNKKITIKNTIFDNLSIKINSYELKDKIGNNYKYCASESNCYDSKEYITPTYDDNYDKAILSINANVSIDKKVNKNLSDFNGIVERFGIIKYTLDGKEKEMRTQVKAAYPTKDSSSDLYYFQVYKEIINADKISLVLSMRNSKYEFILK